MSEPVGSSATRSSSHCQGCGSHVAGSYARVFGDNDDVVQACFNCETASKLFVGASVGIEVE